MLEGLFECLELMKLTPSTVHKQIMILKDSKLNEVVNILNVEIESENKEVNISSSLYNFVANEDLSGGAQYCASIDCRLSKASQMASFASLYADTVLIPNPFKEYLESPHYNKTLREYIADDILIIWYYLPLIKNGIVRFAKSELPFCNDCFNKLINNIKEDTAFKYLQREYLDNVSIYYERNQNENYGKIEILGPEELVEHGAMYINFSDYIPKELRKFSHSEGKHKLDKETLELSGLVNFLPDIIIKDFIIQDWYTKNFDFSYLTNREVDIKLINQTNDYDSNLRNMKLFECMAHQLPVIKDNDINKLLQIREKDGESFVLYRNNMKKLIRELPNNTSHIKEAFSDIVQPEIDKINISISNSRKSIFKNVTKNLIITSGILGIGLTTGILPENIKEIVAVAGGCGLAQTLINNVTDSFTKPNTLRENPYYFLWKVNKIANK